MSDMAIKYAMHKRAKKMSQGGMCAHGKDVCEMCHGGKMMAKGGFVEEEESSGYLPEPKEHAEHEVMHPVENQGFPEEEDMIGRIMKQRAQHYSRGGQVANDTPIHADLEDNQFDDLVKRDDLEQHYTGANSGDEIGDHQEDEDRHDIVTRIMKSRRLKDRNPRPA